MTSGGNYFNDNTENQLTEFPVVYLVKGKILRHDTERLRRPVPLPFKYATAFHLH